MEYRLLGGVEVRDGDRSVDVGPPKQRAILAVLALEADRVVAADRLVELLWDDDATGKAMASLQSYVSRLRTALEPDRRPRDEPAVLLTQPPGYRLSARRDQVDVLRFEDLVAAARERLASGDAASARSITQDALGLWTGPLLPELASEPFVLDAAARLAAVRAAAFEVSGEARLALGDAAGAVALLEAPAAEHAQREHLQGLLALALYRCGRQADALRVVDRCRRELADTSGLDPGPELRRIEADLLAQSSDLDWRPADGGTAPAERPSAHAPAPTPASTAKPPASALIGREHELRTLAGALDAAAAGRGGVAVVVGEPGVGKTRLAEELVAEAQRRGTATAWARCPETGATPPYWPATQLGAQLRDDGVIETQIIVPPEPDDDRNASRNRFDLYRAVAAAITGAGRAMLLVVDDLQWADPDSLHLLEHVAGELSASRALVVLTTRPLDDASPPALVDCLGEVARAPGAVHVALGGLDVDAVGEWLGRRTDVDVPGEVAAVVHDRTGGNALFVKELADLLAAEGRLTDAAAVSSTRAIPPGVQFVVRRRVARLPAAAQQLLSVASVIGRSFDLDVVAAVAGRDPLDALDDLAPALDAGLVVDEGTLFRFSHALVADALAEEVNAARRARTHAAAARLLADRAGADLGTDSALVAHHALLGIPAGSGDLAIEASRRAARLAASRVAYEVAASHWADAAAAIERCRPADLGSRVDALIEQATALLKADFVHAEKQPVLRAIELAGAAGDVDRMVRAAVLLNHAHVWASEGYGVVDADLVAALERTLDAMGTDDLARRADVLGALVCVLAFAEPERRRAVYADAEAIARRSGDPLVLARVLIDGVIPLEPSRHAVHRAAVEEALALAVEHDLPDEVAFAAEFHLATFSYQAADFDGAVARLARCRAIVERMGGLLFRAQVEWFEAALALFRGRYDEARSLGQAAAEVHRRTRAYDVEALDAGLFVATAVDTGGLEELVEVIRGTMGLTAYRWVWGGATAFAVAEVGRLDVAAELLDRLESVPVPDDWTTLCGGAGALHAAVDVGRDDMIPWLAKLLEPYAGRWSASGTSSGAAGLVGLALARAAEWRGDPDVARRLYADAVSGHDRLRAPAWLARSLVHQGRFLAATGDDDDAIAAKAVLDRARRLAERHGLVYVLRRLDQA